MAAFEGTDGAGRATVRVDADGLVTAVTLSAKGALAEPVELTEAVLAGHQAAEAARASALATSGAGVTGLGARELTHRTGQVSVTVTLRGGVTDLDLHRLPPLAPDAAGARIAEAMRAAQEEGLAVLAEESARPGVHRRYPG